MEVINSLFRYVGYVVVSVLLGWLSTLGGIEKDFLFNLKNSVIPVLLTLLVLFTTISNLLIKEVSLYNKGKEIDITPVVNSFKRNTIIEIIIISVLFLTFIVTGVFYRVQVECVEYCFRVVSNSLTAFAFIYFLIVIYDSQSALYTMLKENNKR